ncbi:MAG: rpsI [Solirubrobacterales bacterium]|nr:rpsI [Solirubrobacterales bacterium]
MSDDTNETSEQQPEETSENAAPAPVAEENGADATPVDEAAAAGSEGDTPADEPQREEEPAEAPAAAAEEPAAEEATPAAETSEEPAEAPAEDAPAEAAHAAEREERPAKKDKNDVIPGADLEPIALEPDGPALSAEERARLEAEEEEKRIREAALAAAETDTAVADRAPAKMASGARFLATGKRKSAIARVIVMPGDGKFSINGRELAEFFPRPLHQTMASQPLTVTGYEGNVDIRVRVHGGGISGQAGAVRHGIAKALTEIDAELRGDLKRRGFLTRDARVKERRKAGFKKARKKPQFSKR